MSEPRIDLHIEELVLRGFSPSDRHRFSEALQSELTRLLTAHSKGKTNARAASIERVSIDHISAGSFRVAQGAKPATIATQVGQSVFRQIAPTLGPRQPRTGRK
jgi:hypothetical protein